MKLLNVLKPEYLLRPRSVLRRLWRHACPGRIILPIGRTGGKLRVRGDEYIGLNLRTFGVYDLCLTEVLSRLTPVGGTVVDVGANIGYTAVVIGRRLGQTGRLVALEPIPELFAELEYNLSLNGLVAPAAQPIMAAASNNSGTMRAQFVLGTENDGLFSLESAETNSFGAREIKLVTLDEILADVPQIDLLKIDVEGHETQVLDGATRLLSTRRVRTVIYEDHCPYPSAAYQLLVGHGMRVWQLDTALSGPKLVLPSESTRRTLEPNWIATVDSEDVAAKLMPRGWTVF